MSWRKEWNISSGGKSGSSAKNGSKPAITDKLLEIRGITSEEAKKDFLNPLEITLMHPNAFCDMPKAVERICKAIDTKEKILIYGDFDADGVTSTSLLVKTLSYLGADVDHYIPKRDTEGHGLNEDKINEWFDEEPGLNAADVVKCLSKKNPKLIITVDNGISSVKAVEVINSFGRDVIITDHHEAPDELPPAYAIINPKAVNSLSEELSPLQIDYLTSLAGVGVAFKLAQAVLEKYDKLNFCYEILPYVAVGTIADLVPLIGENRYFVAKGLELISEGKHYGLEKMLKLAGIKPDEGLTSEQIAFIVAPRINASGRLDTVDVAVNVMISDNQQVVDNCIDQLNNYNKLRQAMCSEVFAQADDKWTKTGKRDNAVVLCDEGWHVGIIGIVASKFVEKYYKPAFIMNCSKTSEGKTLYRCSARGVKELNLYDIISAISDKLDGFGGHKLAGGFSFYADKTSFEDVKKAINKTVDEMLAGQKLVPSIDVDMELTPDDLDISLVEEISKLEPFGMGNPSPVFVINNLTLKQKKLMGSTNSHLKLTVEGKNGMIDCVWWSRGDVPLATGDKIDIAFSPQINSFNGNKSLQLVLKDVHSDALDEDEEPKVRVLDHRKKTDMQKQINEHMNSSDKTVAVFAEDKGIIEGLKPYNNIYNNIIDRNHAKKADVLIFFDYPAEEDVLESLMQIVAPDTVCYMKYNNITKEENLLNLFAGMVLYSCNRREGEFNLSNAASALGITNAAVEILLEMYEDAGMLKIKERSENAFYIEYLKPVELSKILQQPKYAEFAELMNTINDYKNKFMLMEV